MANLERPFDRGTRRGLRVLRTLAEECREQRIGLGLSQQAVADAARITRPRYSDFERAKIANLSVVDASVITAVLGLDLSVRTYPGGPPLRDAGQAEDLLGFLRHVRAPLRYRTDVPLPQRPDSPTELRAWDAVIFGNGKRTAVEFEKRIRDAQAMTRRHEMKRRDDPVEMFLLALADQRTNRRVYAEFQDLWPDLRRLRASRVYTMLEAGDHPPSGIVFI